MNAKRIKKAGREAACRTRNLAGNESGVSAIEFALVAPLIFFSLLAMADVGFAVRDRIALDHLLRSGGQVAMRDAGEAAVKRTLENSACKTGETFPDCSDLKNISFVVESYCQCPSATEPDLYCTNTCPVRPAKFYKLSAQKTYTGIFKLRLNFNPSVLVQAR